MDKVKKLKQVDDQEYLSTEEAAKALGIKETAIRNYLSLGRLQVYKFKNLTLLKAEDVEGWKTKQRKK